jgi:hypothetical protein
LFIAIIVLLTAKMVDWFRLVKSIGRLVPAEFLSVHH